MSEFSGKFPELGNSLEERVERYWRVYLRWFVPIPTQTVYCVLCTVYCVLCTVYCVLCTVYCVLCTVYCVLCTVYCVLCTVYCVLCTVYCVLCTVYCVLCTVYCVLCTVYCVLCTVYCVLCTVYCVLCTVYCVLCTVYCVLCTVYSESPKGVLLNESGRFFFYFTQTQPGNLEKRGFWVFYGPNPHRSQKTLFFPDFARFHRGWGHPIICINCFFFHPKT